MDVKVVDGVQGDSSPEDDKFAMPVVNPNAYKNPVGNQAGNWQAGMNNMLGATTGAAPQAGYVDAGKTSTYGGAKMAQGQYNQTYNQEQQLANQLGAMAHGYGPSMAQVQAQQSQQQGLANQMAMLGGQRGAGNPAMAAYQAQQMGAQGMQQAAQQAVQGRTQEQMSAMQAQGQLLGGMNSQAQQFAGNQAQLTQQAMLASMGALNQGNQFQAGLYQQANQGNQQAQMAQNSLNAQQYNNYMSMLQQQNMAQYQANMAMEAQNASDYLVAQGIKKDLAVGQANTTAQWAGAGAGLASGLIGIGAQAVSDITRKKNIKSGKEQLSDMLEDMYNSNKFKKLLIVI